jgi:hypothetical protein
MQLPRMLGTSAFLAALSFEVLAPTHYDDGPCCAALCKMMWKHRLQRTNS